MSQDFLTEEEAVAMVHAVTSDSGNDPMTKQQVLEILNQQVRECTNRIDVACLQREAYLYALTLVGAIE